jgi:hypothetical protein
MSKKIKERFVFPVVSVFAGLLVISVLLEIVLRFLPVCDGGHRLPVNEESPIFRFEPNRTYEWSAEWRFTMTNKIHVNNDGFISSIDYDPDAPGPLIAVIGDSYVEALMVPYEETGQGRLQQALDGEARVYSFAIRGSPLSQYLAFAEYARDTYHPDAMVVVIVGNDFDESLMVYKSEPGYHYFVEGDDGRLELQLVDFSPSKIKEIARHSALARYFMINLELMLLPSRLKARFSRSDQATQYVGNTASDAGALRVSRSKGAVDAFLEQLPGRSGLAPSKILLVVDGIRPHLYDPALLQSVKGTFFDVMRDYIIERGKEAGYEVVDMQPVFLAHFAQYGQRFEYPIDSHWNSLGHELFFEEMYGSSVVAQLRGLAHRNQDDPDRKKDP